MDHREIEERDIVERYLQSRLDAEEATAFETHLLECGECFEQVRWGDEVGHALRIAATQEVVRAAAGAGLWARLARLGRGSQLALLALVGLAVFGPAAYLRAPADAPLGNTPVFFLGAERDAALPGAVVVPSQQIRPSAELGAMILALELDAEPSAGPFQAVLRPLGAPDEVLWQGGGLLLDHHGVLTVSFPARFLAPGDYDLRVASETAPGDAALGRFPFRVLPAGP